MCSQPNTISAIPGLEFVGGFPRGRPDFDGTVKVVSYNIAFGEQVDQAIQDLVGLEELQGTDLFLLQEMDEVGTARIARALGCSFVYYPAWIHEHHGRYFGNAILSRWPLDEGDRIVLPHENPKDGQRRIAVRARADIHGVSVWVYSVHTETPWLSTPKRADQLDAVLEAIDETQAYVIVGGDFNTLTPSSVTELEEKFRQAGMQRASNLAEPSLPLYLLDFTLDHIFTRGMAVLATGAAEEAVAGDHLPIWVTIQPIDRVNVPEFGRDR